MATYNKLVRDNIPDIIERSGKRPVYRKMDKIEYQRALENKLKEETNEYLSNPTSLEELADIEEVLLALTASLGYSEEALKKARLDKKSRNGSFEKRIFLVEVKE